MSIHLNRNAFLIGLGLFAALRAFALTPFDIEFPIPELGDCADKAACKMYCNDAAHADACQAFAEKYGFSTPRPSGTNTPVDAVKADGGPGGCAQGAADGTSAENACRNYCNDASHIEACVSYAHAHNLMSTDELAQADKVVSAIQRGVKLPPQCTNASSCKSTCENPSDEATAKACFAFGKEAGLLPPGVDEAQAERTFQSIESGNGPFKSLKEVQQCDNPPTDEILQKCIEFGTQNGFIKPEEAALIKQTGGKGPGDCRGKEQCDAYCNDHRDECFSFSKDHGLIRPEDQQRMQEGVAQMQKSLNDAPPEVASCIRSSVTNLDTILAGKALPSPQTGDSIRNCFETSFKQNQQNQNQQNQQNQLNQEDRSGDQSDRGRFGPPSHFGPPPGSHPGMPEGNAGAPNDNGQRGDFRDNNRDNNSEHEQYGQPSHGPMNGQMPPMSPEMQKEMQDHMPSGQSSPLPSQQGQTGQPYPQQPYQQMPPQGAPSGQQYQPQSSQQEQYNQQQYNQQSEQPYSGQQGGMTPPPPSGSYSGGQQYSPPPSSGSGGSYQSAPPPSGGDSGGTMSAPPPPPPPSSAAPSGPVSAHSFSSFFANIMSALRGK